MARMRRHQASAFIVGPCLVVLAAAGLLPGCPALERTHTLDVQMEGHGSVTLDPPDGTYTPGEQVLATAQADPGWRFDHWSGDGSGFANPFGIVMNSDKTLEAVFVQAPYFLLLKTVDTAGNTIVDGSEARRMLPRRPDQSAYQDGRAVVIEPPTVPVADLLGRLWIFDHWTDVGEGVIGADSRTLTITMTGSVMTKTATAAFHAAPESP
jgi:hypothetical protein